MPNLDHSEEGWVGQTGEQREYENAVGNPQGRSAKGVVGSINHYAKMPEESKRSIGGRAKWVLKKLNPVSPTARGDLRIMKHSLGVEDHVKQDIHDSELHPEITRVASVRQGNDLCPQEAQFLAARKRYTRDHFARYLDLDPSEVHPEDVPVVGLGGSGGGYRAMIGLLGYCAEMKRAGLWDLITYVAGVSGTCWSMATYYNLGDREWDEVIEHLKRRLSPYHPLSSEAIRAVLSAPMGIQVALGPLVQKQRSGLKLVAMDLYSVFTSSHIFLHDPQQKPAEVSAPKEVGFKRDWFKWSTAQKYVNGGEEPLPILTAIRHERPWKDWEDKEHPFTEDEYDKEQHASAKDAWFQWFEMTPYEVGCDEIACWVPIWGFGRPFSEGRSTQQLPEHSLALLLGLCTSAPAGPMTSYISTIKRNLPTGFIGGRIHDLAAGISKLWGKQGTEVFEGHHPLHACNEHNFIFHLTKPKEGQGRPPGLENSPRIHLIDSGLDNNCPTYVLLHPNRESDVIINMDASSDVQKDTFQQRVDQIGCRKGLRFTKRHPELKAGSNPKDKNRFKGLYAQIYDGVLAPRTETVEDSYGNVVSTPPAPTVSKDCTMVYMPLLPNDAAVPDFDPSTAKFSGSYNLVWTPEQIDMLVNVCKRNFRDGEQTIKQALREAWQRKKRIREQGGGKTQREMQEQQGNGHAGAGVPSSGNGGTAPQAETQQRSGLETLSAGAVQQVTQGDGDSHAAAPINQTLNAEQNV